MIPAATRRLVRHRAGDRCEYCRIAQADEPFVAYQIEHVVPRQHGGSDDEANLALSCPHCNLHKGPNLTGIDPITGLIIPLFHPRSQVWEDHFAAQLPHIVGQTPTGRATIRVLAMNDLARVELRHEAGAS